MAEILNDGRRKARRRWAFTSFSFIIIVGALVFGSLIFSESREDISKALMAAWPLLSAILTVVVSIVWVYLGVSHMDKRLESLKQDVK